MNLTTHNLISSKPLTINLMSDILERDNMRLALKKVKANKGCAGVDNLSIEDTEKHLKDIWPQIKEELLAGKYKPSPVRAVYIPKPGGAGKRMLGIPTVLDRLIQQAIYQKLLPLFDKEFSINSYGFRPGKNAHQAIKAAHKVLQDNHKTIAVDVDLEKFFDIVNHDRLMSKLAKKIEDKALLKLLRGYLNSGIMQNGVHVSRAIGTPQGSPLSPLLSNIVLDELDKELEKREHKFCRYADDIQIYVRTEKAGHRVLESISRFIENKLKLKVNKDKSRVIDATKTSFLGYAFLGWENPRIRCSLETIKRFKYNIRRLTRGHHTMNMQDRLEKLNAYIRGWSNYFCLSQTLKKFKDLDSWIRSRLRMCLMKMWKRPKTRIRNMLNLGLPKEWAGCYVGYRYWHMTQLPDTRFTLDNNFWKQQGYKGISYYFVKFGNA